MFREFGYDEFVDEKVNLVTCVGYVSSLYEDEVNADLYKEHGIEFIDDIDKGRFNDSLLEEVSQELAEAIGDEVRKLIVHFQDDSKVVYYSQGYHEGNLYD